MHLKRNHNPRNFHLSFYNELTYDEDHKRIVYYSGELVKFAKNVLQIIPNSPDDVSVSKYYSGELVKFAKNVLQIIPISVFDALEKLITLLTDKLKPIPLKINKAELKDF